MPVSETPAYGPGDRMSEAERLLHALRGECLFSVAGSSYPLLRCACGVERFATTTWDLPDPVVAAETLAWYGKQLLENPRQENQA